MIIYTKIYFISDVFWKFNYLFLKTEIHLFKIQCFKIHKYYNNIYITLNYL